jgi:hypothetical protein
MTDEVVAFTLREKDPARRRHTYWLIGVTLFTSWNAGSALGVLLGGATGDPAALGLDAAFPAGLIALILPALRDRTTRRVALTGAALAVVLTPVLPAGLPVLAALLGLFAVFIPRRTTDAEPGKQPDRAEPARRPGGAEPARRRGGAEAGKRPGGADAAEQPDGGDGGGREPQTETSRKGATAC